MEAELRDFAARRDIADAAHRYMRGLDRLDPTLLRSAFHDDAVIDVGLKADGVDGYVAFCMELLAGFDGTQHLMGQIRIVFQDAMSASGEFTFRPGMAAGTMLAIPAICSSPAAISTNMPVTMVSGGYRSASLLPTGSRTKRPTMRF